MAIAEARRRSWWFARGPLARAVITLMVLIAVSTGMLMAIEGWGVWESFFVTLITITTVGYGDHSASVPGQIVLVFVMVLGIGCATYAVGAFIQLAVEAASNKERAVQRELETLSGHVIVCGLGRIGQVVCEELHASSRAFVVVDPDHQRVEQAHNEGYLAIERDATHDDALLECGVMRAGAVVAVADDDATNVVVTFTARDLNRDIAIYSRAEQEDSIRKIRRAGATHVVSPTLIGGRHIVEALLRPAAATLLSDYEVGEMQYGLREVHIQPGSPAAGMTIGTLGESHPRVAFVAVASEEGREHRRPQASDRVESGTVLVVAGRLADVLSVMDAAGGDTGAVRLAG